MFSKKKIEMKMIKIEKKKNVPGWVLSCLETYNNCAVSDKTYELIGGIQGLAEVGYKCRVLEKGSGKVIERIWKNEKR